MFERLKHTVQRYVSENFEDLLHLDLKVARLLGAPAPHTLSSYAYKLELEGKPWGKITRPLIDKLMYFLYGEMQTEHCKKDYERVLAGLPAVGLKIK